jgi:hypothetical protein
MLEKIIELVHEQLRRPELFWCIPDIRRSSITQLIVAYDWYSVDTVSVQI